MNRILSEQQIDLLQGNLRPQWAYPIGAMLDTLKLLWRENKRLKEQITELKSGIERLGQ